MLTNFTLIIPTRNRQQYLPRGIEFYKNSDINVIIVDSSEKKYEGKIDALNISYMHYPGHNFVSKIQDVLKKIETPYCGMCADDDFIIPSSLETCVAFLEQNPSYTSVQGNYVYYRKTKKGLTLLPLLHPYKWVISDELPSKRVLNLFDKYFHLFYAVHRTSNFKEFFYSFDNTIKNLNFFEIHIAFVSIINGKHKTLPVFYNTREVIVGSTGQTTGNWLTLFKNEPTIQEWHSKLISEKISVLEGCSKEHAKEIYEAAIRKYIGNPKRLSFVQKIINLFIPASKQYILKNIRMQLAYGGVDNYNISVTKEKEGYPFIEGHDKQELDRIKTIVLKYPV